MSAGRHETGPNIGPELLTVEEAAVIGRCSVKTVRRAYTSGVLMAYRRGGSRAVLLDPQDVRSWLQAALVQSDTVRVPGGDVHSPRAGKPRRVAVRTADIGTPRFDLSADALHQRRVAGSESHA